MKLTPGFLSRKGDKWRAVRLYDVAIMLHNVHAGAHDQDRIGFEDAGRTLEQLTNKLERKVLYEPSLIESALWSCNLMNEIGTFKHPTGAIFDEWLKEVLKFDKFNPIYNLIETKEGKDD
jgi:hypothetical protein